MSTTDIPPTMRAWFHEAPGNPNEVLKFTADFKTPLPSELAHDEVLVKIAYCGTTPAISKLMPIIPSWLQKMPAVPELEFSGTVVALGSKVAALQPDIKVGAPVCGVTSIQLHAKRGVGTLAEYCPCPVSRLARKPENMPFKEAAALAGNGVTALQSLDESNLKRGDKVLINGGSGGTGSVMIQYAKAIVGETGRVVTTCSSESSELVKALGADEAIDYREHAPLHEYLAKEHSQARFDVIIDTVGLQDLYTHCPDYLVEKGRFINIGAMQVESTLSSLLGFFWLQLFNLLWPGLFGGTPRWYRMVSATPNASSLARVKTMAEEGKLKPIIDSAWDMTDALKAYERISSRRSKGKVVIRIQDDGGHNSCYE